MAFNPINNFLSKGVNYNEDSLEDQFQVKFVNGLTIVSIIFAVVAPIYYYFAKGIFGIPFFWGLSAIIIYSIIFIANINGRKKLVNLLITIYANLSLLASLILMPSEYNGIFLIITIFFVYLVLFNKRTEWIAGSILTILIFPISNYIINNFNFYKDAQEIYTSDKVWQNEIPIISFAICLSMFYVFKKARNIERNRILRKLDNHSSNSSDIYDDIDELHFNLIFNSPLVIEKDSMRTQRPLITEINKVVINQLLNNSLSNDQIAESLNYKRTEFYKIIKSISGLTPAQYTKEFRLLLAKEELRKNSKISINKIASNYGFSKSAYFSSEYKKRFGELPSATQNPMK